MANPTGNPTGSGNPPGKYSPSYLKNTKGTSEGQFINAPDYRGDMSVGRNESPTLVGEVRQEGSNNLSSVHEGGI